MSAFGNTFGEVQQGTLLPAWTKKPYFPLPENGVTLVEGESQTIFGDSLINVPIINNLTVTFNCAIGTQSGNNLVITNPVAGTYPCTIHFKNNNRLINFYTINISVIAKVTGAIKKILRIGDSILYSGSYIYTTEIEAALPGNTFTWLGTKGSAHTHEGISGWSYQLFATNVASPFVKAGVINIPAYFTDNLIDIPDIVSFNCGVNDTFAACAIAGDGLTDAEITTIINYAKSLINAFLAFDNNLKIIIHLPTTCDRDSGAWNFDANVYSEDRFIENIHKFQTALTNTFANSAYNARVLTDYDFIFLDRAKFVNNGIHPVIPDGYEQLGAGKVGLFNKILHTSLKEAFITKWDTEKAGSATKTIVLPVNVFNCVIDWGDGIIEHKNSTVTPGTITHVYAETGIYTVKINGYLAAIAFNDSGDKAKIISIDQWGNCGFTNFASAYKGCVNLLANYTDAPIGNAFTSLYSMFYGAIKFNGSLGGFDIRNVTALNLATYATAINTANYDATLIAWSTQTVKYNISVNFGSVKYSAAAIAARSILTSAPNSWVITDGGQV